MAYPKSSKSALLALVTAGGFWAWKNRDKLSSQFSQLSSQLSQPRPTNYTKPLTDQAHIPAVEAYTGGTQRIGNEANDI